MTNQSSDSKLLERACEELKDTTSFVFFDEKCNILCSSSKVENDTLELEALKGVFNRERDRVVRSGIMLQKKQYEVYRFDPPLVYGRNMTGESICSAAFALCKVSTGQNNTPAYGIITFVLPQLTARLVPKLAAFCEQYIQCTNETQLKP